MPDTTESFLHDQLVERRRRLESTAKVAGLEGGIAELLNEVDAALERMESGTYGFCDACHESIEKDRLLADPLARLSHQNSEPVQSSRPLFVRFIFFLTGPKY